MKALDYFVILLVLIWFLAAFRYIIGMKKRGKSICCGSCGSNCGQCRTGKQGKVGVELSENTGGRGKLS